MSARPKVVPEKDRFTFYMDLLGHDVLNNNQAVLSYLELIAASPGVDNNVKTLAEKAVSHVRTSTVLIDNVKRLIATREIKLARLKPTDIVRTIDRAELGLRRHFPAKKIHLERMGLPKGAFVLGEDYADELILNVFITAVRLSHGDVVNLKVTCAKGEIKGKPAWTTSIEDKRAQLPPFLDGQSVSAAYSQDISTAVKTTGILFAMMLATSLGGDFEARSIRKDPRAGAVFTVTLREAEGP